MTDTQSTPFVNPPEILYRLRAANGDLLYVGITRDFPARLKQHYADKPWAYEIRSTEQVHIDGTRAQIEAIEKAVIIVERPLYNKQHNEAVRRTLAAPKPAETQEKIVPQGVTENNIRDYERFTGRPYGTPEKYVIGDDVEHFTFGRGIVLDVRGSGDLAEVTVRFQGVGAKHLSTAWAPMRSTF